MSEGCTKQELIKSIAKKEKLHPRIVAQIIENFFDTIEEGLSQGKRFEFRRFGVFSVVLKKKKIGRNPKKAEISITIPERHAVQFKPSYYLKKLVETEMSDLSGDVL